jgi:outer membrane protein OmpA-like peptidoglycan-associated protein
MRSDKRLTILSTIPGVLVLALVLANVTGCSSTNNATKGAVIGAAAGGVAGGVIGNQTGSTARGAIIGAVVGGAAGAHIGHQMDGRPRVEQNVPGAIVERGERAFTSPSLRALFDFDSDVVRSNAATNLNALAGNLSVRRVKSNDRREHGHRRELEYNQNLSEQRRVRGPLPSGRGVTRYIATAGSAARASPSNTRRGRQRNRRVEIAIYASDPGRRAAPTAAR